jgi:hypothetical protein
MTAIQMERHASYLVYDQTWMDTEALRRVVKQIYAIRLVINLLRCVIIRMLVISLIIRLVFSRY